VTAPCLRAASNTATTSGDCPDWLTPMTTACSTEGAASYRVKSEGMARATVRWLWVPKRYCA
jgi:hypothetical protein